MRNTSNQELLQTELSMDEKKAYIRQLFEKVDSNMNGFISEPEFVSFTRLKVSN